MAGNERTSGSARFMGWPDVFWTFTVSDGERFMSALGRDVDQDEFKLAWSDADHRLSVDALGVSRAKAIRSEMSKDVFDYVLANPGVSGTQIKTMVTGSSTAIGATIRQLVGDGLLPAKTGPRNATHHEVPTGVTWALGS